VAIHSWNRLRSSWVVGESGEGTGATPASAKPADGASLATSDGESGWAIALIS
jgi:hypothetical protein